MKKNVLIATLALCFAACSTGTSTNNSSITNVTSTNPPAEGNETVQEVTETNSDVLVVYYSATNTTEGVAEVIADTLNADVFEIEPVQPYTSEDLTWTNQNSRVVQEHDNESLQNIELVSTTVENWDTYTTVFIGYPIWWGNASWVVNSFVIENNFSGKTVIPFATSQSSGFGQSGENLANLTNTGTWIDGERFSATSSDDTIREWAINVLK